MIIRTGIARGKPVGSMLGGFREDLGIFEETGGGGGGGVSAQKVLPARNLPVRERLLALWQ